jgi:phosphoglycerate dehydrogenase-like enzyme
MMKIAILDDYQNVALQMADWTAISKRAEVTVFNDHLSDPDAIVRRLEPFDVVCVMRERTPLRRAAIARLPNLKLIASTASRNAGIDVEAAKEHGIAIATTGYRSTPTIEMTWALILASARNVVDESVALRNGGWQQGIGEELEGKTLGVLGLGNVGGPVARIGSAFGMNVIAWSQNMTAELAQRAGAEFVSKEQLFERSDTYQTPGYERPFAGVGGSQPTEFDEDDRETCKHVPWPARGRRRAHRCARASAHSGRGPRCVRSRAVVQRPSI